MLFYPHPRKHSSLFRNLVSGDEKKFHNFDTSIVNLAVLLAVALIRSKINGLALSEITLYPNYYYLYISQLILPNVFPFVVITFYYINHSSLRQKLFSSLKNCIKLNYNQ
jgi:hypothetical protein